jgi:nicotinate-nucleotide pyrophosphorylase (carboxylating)
MKLPDQIAAQLLQAGLDPSEVAGVAVGALAEDAAGGDVTSTATITADARAVADFVVRGEGVLAGLPVAETVLHVATAGDLQILARARDGDLVQRGEVVLTVSGPTRALLAGERTALNLLCHLSGVATLTARWVDAIADTGAAVRDTRKTTPGLRALEKYAVRCGGGVNHRMSLADAALIKDNHVLAAGGVVAAFDAVRAKFPDVPLEVEVDSLQQLDAVLAAGADLVLLDNFSVPETAEAVRQVAGRARLESSGGLTLAVAHDYAATGVDYLAVGALTHSAPVLDIAMDLDMSGPQQQEA